MKLELKEKDLAEIAEVGDPYHVASMRAIYDLWVVSQTVGPDIDGDLREGVIEQLFQAAYRTLSAVYADVAKAAFVRVPCGNCGTFLGLIKVGVFIECECGMSGEVVICEEVGSIN